MVKHSEISGPGLRKLIRQGKVCFGGNQKHKIYGTLKCGSGKGMKKVNRVFFVSGEEAIKLGYRPCGNCMKSEYQKWKNGFVQY